MILVYIVDNLKSNNIKSSKIQHFFGKSTIICKRSKQEIYNIKNNDTLFVNKRLRGGIFTTIIMALVKMVEFLVLILTYLDDLIMIFVKLVEIIPLIFNPKKFIDIIKKTIN